MTRFILLALLALVTRSQAIVLVYTGSGKSISKPTIDAFGKQPHFYFVLDTSTQEMHQIIYYSLAGSKKSQGYPPIPKSRYASNVLSATKKLGVFSAVHDVGLTGQEYGYEMFDFRGNEKRLIVSNSVTPVTGNYPKTVTGFYRFSSFVSGHYGDFAYDVVLSFDASHTQVANNSFTGGADTRDLIISELVQKGFK